MNALIQYSLNNSMASTIILLLACVLALHLGAEANPMPAGNDGNANEAGQSAMDTIMETNEKAQVIDQMFHGDVRLTIEQKRKRRSNEFQGPQDAALLKELGTGPRWPGGRVPYVIDSSISADGVKVIESAFEEYRQRTCIRFVRATSQDTDRVIFKSLNGCYSYIGRIGGEQEISLGNGCLWKNVVLHECLHALGFFHEQSRLDRDQYVSINFDNIMAGFERNFDRVDSSYASSYNSPYDLNGIMHYGNRAFAKDRNINTISAIINGKIDPSYRLGTNAGLSESDVDQLMAYYDCAPPEVTTPTTVPTTEATTTQPPTTEATTTTKPPTTKATTTTSPPTTTTPPPTTTKETTTTASTTTTTKPPTTKPTTTTNPPTTTTKPPTTKATTTTTPPTTTKATTTTPPPTTTKATTTTASTTTTTKPPTTKAKTTTSRPTTTAEVTTSTKRPTTTESPTTKATTKKTTTQTTVKETTTVLSTTEATRPTTKASTIETTTDETTSKPTTSTTTDSTSTLSPGLCTDDYYDSWCKSFKNTERKCRRSGWFRNTCPKTCACATAKDLRCVEDEYDAWCKRYRKRQHANLCANSTWFPNCCPRTCACVLGAVPPS